MPPTARDMLEEAARFFGTLRGASKEQVEIEERVLEVMRECARFIGRQLKADAAAPA